MSTLIAMAATFDETGPRFAAQPLSRWQWALAIAGVIMVLTIVSDRMHPATGVALLAFHFSCALLIALAFPRPRSHVYSALTLVLFLGYWPKFVIRLIAPGPYLEPIGRFDGTPESWDRALLVTAVGFSGVAIARVAHLLWTRKAAQSVAAVAAPQLYLRYRAFVWAFTAMCVMGGYAWNVHASVYVTGVNPTIVLPFSMNVVLAWCYIMAFPLWIAILVGWELQRRRNNVLSWPLLLVPLLEGIINAGSLMSRASYLLRLAPYLLATTRGKEPHGPIRLPRPRAITGAALAAGFSLSIVAVMALRTVVYLGPGPEPAVVENGHSTMATQSARPVATGPTPRPAEAGSVPSAVTAKAPRAAEAQTLPPTSVTKLRPLGDIAYEVGTLFLDRWTGLEGVLVVTGSDRGTDVLVQMVQEDPQRGTDSIYQRMADARYERQDRFTFLTLAGVIALLATADSWWLIFGGMGIAAAVLMLAEGVTRRITHNEIACSVVAVTGAFVVSQATYPRLLGVFVIELWATLAALAALMWLLTRAGSARTL